MAAIYYSPAAGVNWNLRIRQILDVPGSRHLDEAGVLARASGRLTV